MIACQKIRQTSEKKSVPDKKRDVGMEGSINVNLTPTLLLVDFKGGRTPPTHSVAMCSNYRSSPCKTILPIYKLQVPPEDTTLQL